MDYYAPAPQPSQSCRSPDLWSGFLRTSTFVAARGGERWSAVRRGRAPRTTFRDEIRLHAGDRVQYGGGRRWDEVAGPAAGCRELRFPAGRRGGPLCAGTWDEGPRPLSGLG